MYNKTNNITSIIILFNIRKHKVITALDNLSLYTARNFLKLKVGFVLLYPIVDETFYSQ